MKSREKQEKVTLCCIASRVENNQRFYGRFQLGPFDAGQGLTVANSLRRTLLSELTGLGIVAVEIEGARHEYSIVPGIRESVLDILLNLKAVVLTTRFQFNQPQVGYLQIKGPVIVKAGDLKLPLSIQAVDPEQYIATISYDGVLNMKFFICQGKNFISFSNFSSQIQDQKKDFLFLNYIENDNLSAIAKKSSFEYSSFSNFNENFNSVSLVQIGKTTQLLPIDAVFMPIIQVNYIIETYQSFQYAKLKERIILEIVTNGSIHPRQAIHEAAKILVKLFSPFQKTRLLKSFFYQPIRSFSKKKESLKKITSLDIGNLELSLRPYTCLKRANIHTIGDLLEYSEEELLLLKNFGKRSLEEVQLLLYQIGFHLKKNSDNELKGVST